MHLFAHIMSVPLASFDKEINDLYTTSVNMGTVSIERVQDYIARLMKKLESDQACFLLVVVRSQLNQRDKIMFATAKRLALFFQMFRKAHGLLVLIENQTNEQVNYELNKEQEDTLACAHAALDRFENYTELKSIVTELRFKVHFF